MSTASKPLFSDIFCPFAVLATDRCSIGLIHRAGSVPIRRMRILSPAESFSKNRLNPLYSATALLSALSNFTFKPLVDP